MPACVIIDFDDTLFDTARWYEESLSRSLEPFGVSSSDFKSAYPKGDEATAGLIGWSPEAEATYLEEYLRRNGHCHALARDSAVAAITACVDSCASFLFSDAKDVLGRLREQYRVVLLSRGNVDFQRRKIRVTGVGELVEEVIVTPDHKAMAIRTILKPNDNPVYFIEDNIASSLEVKELFPLLNVVLKRRRDTSPEQYQLLTFPSFDSLTEVADFVLFNSPLAKRG